MNQIDLNEKVAVITGGAQGIGLAIAERMLDSGASVSLWDRDQKLVEETARLLESRGKAEAVVVDVTDLDSVKSATEKTKTSMGSIDILVCNAGIAGPTVKVWEYPPEEWQQVIDIDLTGVFHCLHTVSPVMPLVVTTITAVSPISNVPTLCTQSASIRSNFSIASFNI